MTAQHLGFVFVYAGWLTFVAAAVLTFSVFFKPKETSDAAS